MFLAKKTVCDIFHKKDGKSLTKKSLCSQKS